MRITDLCSGRGRSKDIQPPSRNDSPATGIAAENTILVPLCAGLGYGFGFGAPERAGQTQVTALDLRRFKPTEKAGGMAIRRAVAVLPTFKNGMRLGWS
jgi:hypothetical protein